MSVVRRVAPGDRLDRLEFSPRAEYLDHAVHLGAYTCPRCGRAVAFETRHFRDAEHEPSSNLASPWRERFDAARPLDRRRRESFLDFHCPGCGAPVRVVYAPGDEFAMGAHSWRLLEVLKAAEWPGAGHRDQLG